MNFITTLSLSLLIGSSAFAETTLECRDGETASWLKSGDLNDFRGSMDLRHNFASASLNCSSETDAAIKEEMAFRCAGVWVFDSRRPDATIGTLAVAEFSKKEDSTWIAKFTTSYDYDRQDIEMECLLKTDEK